MEAESSQEHIKVNSAEDALEGLGDNPKHKGAMKSLEPQEDSQADKRSGKVPSINDIEKYVKVTGLNCLNCYS
eukprot:9414585-Heterocapsa_arctica.AAC.1